MPNDIGAATTVEAYASDTVGLCGLIALLLVLIFIRFGRIHKTFRALQQKH
jgi:hypothetical protein